MLMIGVKIGVYGSSHKRSVHLYEPLLYLRLSLIYNNYLYVPTCWTGQRKRRERENVVRDGGGGHSIIQSHNIRLYIA